MHDWGYKVTNRCINLQMIQPDSQIQLFLFWQENDLCRRKDIRIISHWREKTSTEREEPQQNVKYRDTANTNQRKGTRQYLN
jgi:hypothetical protein